jgi:hypothetical protein
VTAYAKDSAVYGYGIDVSRACNVNLSDMTGYALPDIYGATFGTIAQAGIDGVIQATCLADCGNSSDPLIVAYSEGPHAVNFIDVELSVPLVTDASLNAADAWEKAMKPEGQGYLENARFNCGDRHQAVAQQAFKDIAVTHVFVGHGQDEVENAILKSCPTR